MIGNRQAPRSMRRQFESNKIFGDVLGKRRDARRLAGIGGIKPQHVAVILDGGAATRRGDDDSVKAAIFHLPRPDIDITPCLSERLFLPAHMMHQRAAAALALRHHNLNAEPREKPQRCLIDTGVEHRLGAAGKDGDAPALFALGRSFSRTGGGGGRRNSSGGESEHGLQRF
ncbi:hypothetical protein D3C86_1255900 [compost metagenome]